MCLGRLTVPVVATAVLALAACGDDSNSGSLRTPQPAADAAAGFTPIEPVDIVAQPIASAERPVDLAVRPNDDAVYVVEHAGRVVRILDDDVRVVADVSDRLIGHANEQGLTGLEFSADGATAWIHATDAAGVTTVSEVSLDTDGTFDLGTERVMIRWSDPPGRNHNSGDLLLMSDGTLLITLGDGDAANDPHRFAHDPSTLRGSILRVRPTPGAARPYEVPDDNPFADGALVAEDGSEVHGAPEVFAWGLRNPWKLDVDPVSGSLWIADVGSADAEEINVAVAEDGRPAGWGTDFGWSRFEGTQTLNDDVEPLLGVPVDPVHTYAHEGIRCAISGGVVYRGSGIPQLRSGYVFADFCEGSVWVYDSTTGDAVPLLGAPAGIPGVPGITGVRTGPDGELFVLSIQGGIYRLMPA